MKTVGLLFNFLVAFEANQGVTLSKPIKGRQNLKGLSAQGKESLGVRPF